MKTRLVKVSFKNGNSITTHINGTTESISEYYRVGRFFNIGNIVDDMQPVEGLEFIN